MTPSAIVLKDIMMAYQDVQPSIRVLHPKLCRMRLLHLFRFSQAAPAGSLVKEGAKMDFPLQTVHLCLLKRILGQEHYTQ
eukprot:1160856-Pelagomonas_calceolata.AAC.4